jgi:Peptidase C13 family/YcxB-like protein
MKSSYTYTLSQAEVARAAALRGRRLALPAWMRPAGFLCVVALFAAFGFLMTMSYGHRSVPAKMVFNATMVALAAAMLSWLVQRSALAAMLRANTFHASVPRTLAIEEEGLRIAGSTLDAFYPWAAFSGVEAREGLVFLMLDTMSFYAVPDAAFESETEREEFVGFVRGKIGDAGGSADQGVAPPTTTLSPLGGSPTGRGGISVWRMFLDAFRLAFFRYVPEERMARGWGTVLAAAFVTLLIPAVPAVWSVGLAGEWSWYALPSAVFHVPLIFVAAIAIAYVLGRRDDVAHLALAGFLAAAAIDLMATIFAASAANAPNFRQLTMTFSWLPGTWLAFALSTYACRTIERGERRLGVVAACIALIAFPLANVYRDRTLWHAPYVPEEAASGAGRMSAAGEDAFYKQPALLARELAGVRPGRKGVVDVFFIGVAGYASQDVFMKEVNAVSNLFRERFGAEGHVIRLVNNPKSLFEAPIASRTSLREAVRRMGEVMDKDEDVLVLFLTSHGSEDHKFSLSLWPLRFHDVDPPTVRAALDDAGIVNRVVIISACYSGGFVKALESPGTLVITAAAADRTSFGCTSEAEWTYFGKAYFDDALRKTHSFAKAFEIAKPAVTAREKSENFDPSEPQISMGTAIAAKLDALSAQLDRK